MPFLATLKIQNGDLGWKISIYNMRIVLVQQNQDQVDASQVCSVKIAVGNLFNN